MINNPLTANKIIIFSIAMAIICLRPCLAQEKKSVLEVAPSEAPAVFTELEAVELTLQQVIELTLENSRSLKDAYLLRKSSTYDLEVAKDTFIPNLNLESTYGKSGGETKSDLEGELTEKDESLEASAELSILLPTGAELSAAYAYDKLDLEQELEESLTPFDRDTKTEDRGLTVSLKQPLLRNAGLPVNLATVKIAKGTDELSRLALKQSLIDTLTQAVISYYDLVKYQRSVKIQEQSLQLAREQHEKVSTLVSAGRVAELDLVQSEADIQTNLLRLLQAQDAFESSQLEFNKILDLNPIYRVTPAGELSAPLDNADARLAKLLDRNKALSYAFDNRPDYLAAEKALEISKLALVQADNNRLPDLDAVGSYVSGDGEEKIEGTADSEDETERESWQAGLQFSYPVGDLTRRQRYQQAKVAVQRAENDLEDVRRDVEIEVKDSLRYIEKTRKSYMVAMKARELTEKKLEVELTKLESGRSSVFQITTFKNDVEQARLNELFATVDYLSALALHEQVLGSTCEKWGVAIEERE